MANIKISELTALTPPDAADLVPVVDTTAPSSTKRTTVGEIVGIINGDVDVANTGTATISELPVSKLQDGAARQLLQTDASGTGVEWTSNVDVPGTLDVTGAATLDAALNVAGLASLDGGIDVDGAFTVANTSGNIATSGTLGVDGQSTLASAAVSDLTSGRVVLAGTSGELEDNVGLTFNGTQLDVDGDVAVTGSLIFEGNTADDYETTLAVTDPTADRTITLPNVSGTVVTTGDTGSVTSTMIADGTIVNADVSATAKIAVSKLANGTVNQVLVTDGTNVSWSDDLTLAGNLTVNGTTTTVNTETLVVEDKNIELGVVASPTDVTADGGGITLKGSTDKTITWVDATDAWTSSERFSVPLGSAGAPSLTFTGDPNTGIYSPGADQLALSTNGTGRLTIDGSGNINVDNGGLYYDASTNRLAIGTTSPVEQLHVSGSSAINTRFESSTTTTLIRFVNSTASDGYIGYANQNLTFYAANAERARIDSSGRLLVGTSSDSGGALLQVNGDRVRIATAKTPASATDTGTAGEVCWDANYIYVCTATNTWKRTAIATW